MTGGCDAFLSVRPSPHVRKTLAQKLCVLWPNGMVEYDILQPLGPDSLLRAEDVFVYEDRRSFDSWSKLGCTEQNEDAMVHLTFAKDGIAITYGAGLEPFVESLRRALA